MQIDDLRTIGKRLFSAIGQTRLSPCDSASIGKGAGGDKTFPIDKTAEDIIISSLQDLGEPLNVISEEAGLLDMRGGGYRVIIDPIDGSKNAINGIPFYCTSIAVAGGAEMGSVFLSYVINLLTGDEFWAERGKGAFFGGRRITTQQDDILRLVAYEAQTPGRDIPVIMPLLGASQRTRCLGATALDLAYVAYGAVSIFIAPAMSRSYDFAGGWLLVREAGGVFTDLDGNSLEHLEISLGRSAPLLASGNEALHDRALRLLHA